MSFFAAVAEDKATFSLKSLCKTRNQKRKMAEALEAAQPTCNYCDKGLTIDTPVSIYQDSTGGIGFLHGFGTCYGNGHLERLEPSFDEAIDILKRHAEIQ